MCFSPTASFTASAALAAIGIAALCKVKSKSGILFAATPLLFAAQQFIEGLLWSHLLHVNNSIPQIWLIMSYGFFAGMLWPVYVPVSLLLMEPDHKRKKIMGEIAAVGLCIAIYVFTEMLHVHVTARIANSCVLYEYPSLPYDHLVLPMYVIATCAAFFAATDHKLRWLGRVNIVTFMLAYLFYNYLLVSVWCFFAAIISSLIYFYFYFAAKHNAVRL